MYSQTTKLIGALLMFTTALAANAHYDKHEKYKNHYYYPKYFKSSVELGPRPFYLVDNLEHGRLKKKLERCEKGPFYKTDFSIGHRGAPMQFPEHTKESYIAAAKTGAGILECDVTFTADGELVCRHAQCDLHTTTNIITTELNNRCTTPWDHNNPNPGGVKCCASDLTLAEFKTLHGKMDSADRQATTAEEYQSGIAEWRTGLYEGEGTLMTHAESIKLFRSLGAKFAPELKGPDRGAAIQVEDVFGSQQAYAQKLIDEYIEAGIAAKHVWAQSFNLDDVKYWIDNNPRFGKQAVYLDDRYNSGIDPNDPSTFKPSMKELAKSGIQVIAPPMWMLLKVKDNGKIVPSAYARKARRVGLDIITWTFERSDLRNGSRSGVDSEGNPITTWYYQFDNNPKAQAIKTDGDMYKALHVLAKDVKILGIFSDWPATVTYYANCMGLK